MSSNAPNAPAPDSLDKRSRTGVTPKIEPLQSGTKLVGQSGMHAKDERKYILKNIFHTSVASSSNSSVQFKFEAELNAPQYENA
ncbi:hypothetical protein VC83_01451 [Pseudogymnoascus destructans]|uniref:Uncharacterized protein n=1 Tax=Pseudogymnoascus destructans TaxID=655981 RepID=A0A177AJ59_9PEZI|nr:uncharacterized protein VC83_01451 [Pseudogymnoascus destructans]OAF62107.1 hypothetical protein VC83_01451 [Pseudogymnoascus destructans]